MKTEKTLLYLILASITAIVLIPFIKTGLATGDDAEFLLVGLSEKLTGSAFIYAKNAGRFYFIITQAFYNLPYLINSITIIKSINIIFLTIDLVLFCAIVKQIFNNKKISYILYLLLLTFISIKGANNPIVSFQWYFTGSFIFILLSLFYALKYAQLNKKIHKILSIIFFTVGLIFYEVYLLYMPIIVLAIFKNNFELKDLAIRSKFVSILKTSSPFIIISLLYVVAYFTFRVFYPPDYTGTSFAHNFNISDSVSTIFSLSRGAYPCHFFFGGKSVFINSSPLLQNHIQNLGYVLANANYLWYIKAIVIAWLSFMFLNEVKLKNIKKVLVIFALAVLYIYIPQIPLALTVKYTYQYPGMDNYITTLFAFFSIMLTIAILFSMVSFIKNLIIKKILIIIIVISISIGSIITDYINYHAVKDLQQPLNTLNCINKFIKTKEFNSLPNNAFVYSPNLYKNSDISYMYSQGFKWDHYVHLKTKKRIQFVKSKDKLIKAFNSKKENLYFLKYDFNKKNIDQFMALGEINKSSIIDTLQSTIYSDSLTCFYYSTHKSFKLSFSFGTESANPFSYSVFDKTYTTANNSALIKFEYDNYQNYFKPIKIKAKNINMHSLIISNLIDDKSTDVIIY